MRTLYGSDLSTMSDHELARYLDRSMVQSADALRYSGPAGADMYRAEVRKVIAEQERRKSGLTAVRR